MSTAPIPFTPRHPRLGSSFDVPAHSEEEAWQTLAAIGGGSLLGTGLTFRTDIERLRREYNEQVRTLDAEIKAKRARGVPDSELRPWADAERTHIARSVRMRQGPVATVVLEGRDWLPPQTSPSLRRFSGYGWGGRSEANLERRALASQTFRDSGLSLDEWLLRGAVRPNAAVSQSALRAGQYLRAGGKILVPLGVGLSAYAVVTAPAGEKLPTAATEGASWLGGTAASEGAVALLLALAPETGGLTLIGVALVAGAGGGILSSWGAHKLFFSKHPAAPPESSIPSSDIRTHP